MRGGLGWFLYKKVTFFAPLTPPSPTHKTTTMGFVDCDFYFTLWNLNGFCVFSSYLDLNVRRREMILGNFDAFLLHIMKFQWIVEINFGIFDDFYLILYNFNGFCAFPSYLEFFSVPKSSCNTFFALWKVCFVPPEPPRASAMYPHIAWERPSRPRGVGNLRAILPRYCPACESWLEGYSVRVSA